MLFNRAADLNHTKQSGFTLVELLVAIIVGTVFVTSINTVVNSHAYLAQRTQNLIFANAFAEGKIEGLRSGGYLSLADGTTDISAELPAELVAPRSGTLQISTSSAGIRRIQLSITYNDLSTPRTYNYTSLIGELGVGQY